MSTPTVIVPANVPERKVPVEVQVPNGAKEFFVPKDDASPEPRYDIMLAE